MASSPVCDSPFDIYAREVEQMANTFTPLGELENAIDATELAVDEKAALWMLAWSLVGPEIRHEETEAKLALMGAGAPSDEFDWSRL